MSESASALLASWSSFYVMTGSAAAALTGLMFVVISLVMGRVRQSNRDGISTFSTPTVFHFGAALLVSGALVAPWHELLLPAFAVGAVGAYGAVYVARIISRTRELHEYAADAEDWIWYAVMPLIAYAIAIGGAIALAVVVTKALFAIGAAVLMLIFVGIRNAWDVVTYIAVSGPGDAD
jgi:hypothetical protein